MYNIFEEETKPEKLSDVKTKKGVFPEGTFKKSAEEIAKIAKRNSRSVGQAIRRINFYINRGGDNLTKNRKNVLKAAIKHLQKTEESSVLDNNLKLFEVDVSQPRDSLTRKEVQFIRDFRLFYRAISPHRSVNDIKHICRYLRRELLKTQFDENNLKNREKLTNLFNEADVPGKYIEQLVDYILDYNDE